MEKPTEFKASDLMITKMVTLKPEMSAIEALNTITGNKVPVAPVVDENMVLIGMLSETDLLKTVVSSTYHNNFILAGTVEELMTKSIKTVTPDTNLLALASLFLENTYRRFPVVENDQLLGMVSRLNVLNAIKKSAVKNVDEHHSGIPSNPKDSRPAQE